MSILTAIFQAIGQALTFVFPVSDTGHSAIFHNFAGSYTNSTSELTGLIYIGIALGLIIAFYKVFLRLIREFTLTWRDIFKKQFSLKNASGSRKFMYLTFIPFILMLAYLIPAGEKYGNVYHLLNSFAHDANLLVEGICFLITATILLLATIELNKDPKGRPLTLTTAIITAVLVFITLPMPGLSLSATIICVLIIFQINKKAAFRYFTCISCPTLIVMGILEIINCGQYVKILPGIIAVVISAAVAYLAGKTLLALISNNRIKYFSYYNYAIGAIITVIGIVETVS